ncbi:MAG TPA: hypothetical protein VN156_02560, partial [Pseudomonas sp.]|nr:hypothetical protein [Pseudomonas sp.]
SLEMLLAGVYRPVPLMTTLCTVIPLVLAAGRGQVSQAAPGGRHGARILRVDGARRLPQVMAQSVPQTGAFRPLLERSAD